MDDLNPELVKCLSRGGICIEIDRSADLAAMLRSSNGVFCTPLPVAEVEQIMMSVKQRAGLDVTACVVQEGVFDYGSARYRVNCCPQYCGEIVVVRHVSGWLPSSTSAPSIRVSARPGLLGRLRRFALARWRRR